MATIQHVHDDLAQKTVEILWETMGDDDVGSGVALGSYDELTVHVTGTFGGATVTIEGSPDDSAWVTMPDLNGTLLSLTAASVEKVGPAPKFIRPQTAGGSGTDVDVRLVARRK